MSSKHAIQRTVLIQPQSFDPFALLQNYQQDRFHGKTDFGATASFVGTMRDFNEGDVVARMELEHYPGMTEKHLESIIDAAAAKWSLQHVLILHRVGEILPGEAIMLVAVWSAHRAAAFDACRYLLEELKHRTPFWKKETLEGDRSRWVEKNTPG